MNCSYRYFKFLTEFTFKDCEFHLQQAGPLITVKIPKDSNGEQRPYAFIDFKHDCSVDYAINLFQDTFLFGKELQLSRRRAKNQNSSEDANPHLRRQTSLPNMHQRATGVLLRPAYPTIGVPNLNTPYHPMLFNHGFIPPIHLTMGPRSAFVMEQTTRVQRHHSDRRNRYDHHHMEDDRERYTDLDREHSDSRRDRSERNHRRSRSEHHSHRSRSRSRSRSPERSSRHGDRDHDRRNRYDRDVSDYRRDEQRSRYWDR